MAGVGASARAVFIVNVGSRRARNQAGRARRLLQTAGVSLRATYGLRDPARLPHIVRAVLAEGCDLIILGGGDGSVSAVVAELTKHDALLGLLPLGTANDFARSLGVPDDLEKACAIIAEGREAAVDLGLAGEHYFVNVITMGLGAEVINSASARLKRLLGPLAYPLATALALRRFRPFAASLTFPDGDHAPATYDRLLQLAVGNGRYHGGGAVVAPTARIDDGMLDVYAIEFKSWRALIGVAWSFKSGRQVRRDDVPYWRTRHLRVATRPALPVNLDGELVDETPELFSIVRTKLRVLVPREGPTKGNTAASDRTEPAQIDA